MAFGLRSSELVNNGPAWQRFGYDLLGSGGAPEKLSDYSGTSLANQYVFGVGVDVPLEMYNGTTFFLYHRDALGSVTSITDYTGTVDGSYSYDAWGNLLQSADTMSNLLRYTASPYDPTLGLVYDRARWYDPSTGRFLTPDPMSGGYAYAADSPTNYADPTGRSPYAFAGPGAGEAPGTGEGCTMAMYLAGQCFMPKRQPVGGLHYSWERCGLPIALFAVGIVLALAGLYVGDMMSNDQLAAYLTVGSWEGDLTALATGSTNIWGTVQLIWDIGTYLIFDVIIPALSWWQQALAVGEELAEWTPPGISVHLPLALVSIGVGAAGLFADSCVPGE